MRMETRIVRRNNTEVRQIKSSKDWTMEGDEAKKRYYYGKALRCYFKALDSSTPTERMYLIPRVMACYRGLDNPGRAKAFFREMKSRYGISSMDHASYTVMAAVYGDLKEWELALECADWACKLNDGVINQHLDAVYGRINYNMEYRSNNCCLA